VKIAIVSDIHGNAAALARALELVQPVDEVFCLGDTINQFCFSNEVVALLQACDVQTILGNHEEIFFSSLGERARSAPWIDRDRMHWLGAQPSQRVIQRAGKTILLVHSTPWPSGGAYICEHDSRFARFGDTGSNIVLYGHTHLPVARRVRNTLVINPGSTGEARFVNGRLELSCAVLDLLTEDVRIINFAEANSPGGMTY
jgi:putative phosphoesterase